MSHDCAPEFLEDLALERFGKEITHHPVGRTVHYIKVTLFDSVVNEEIPYIDVARIAST